MKAIDCKACRTEIDRAGPGERTPVDALAHLATCERCRAFREERLALRELVSSLGTVTAPHDFDWRLRARLASERRASSRHPFRRGFAPGTPAIALAASFALLLGVAVLLKQADRRLNTTPPSELAAAKSVAVNPADRLSGSTEAAVASTDDRSATVRTQASAGDSLQRGARAQRSKSTREETGASALAEARRNAPVRSNDFSSSAAPVITLFSVPVSSPSQPVKVLLDEGGGVTRTVSLQSVTFGSQEIFGRRFVPRRLDAGAEEIW